MAEVLKTTVLPIVLFLIGLVFIVRGGDLFVDAATWMAEASRIPKVLVGATVVSFATTLPELLVSFLAALDGSNEMAIGNAVGSVSANIGLIFALLMVASPAVCKRDGFMVKGLLMLGACITLAAFGFFGPHELPWYGSVLLIAIYVVFMTLNVREALASVKKEKTLEGGLSSQTDGEAVKTDRRTVAINIVKFIVGAAGIAGGAFLLVDNGQIIATDILGIPVAVVSAIFVAIGTSLPELVTAITAIVKKQGALSMGNIIGANIIDLSVILPVCSLVSGGVVPFTAQNFYLDLPVCLTIGAVALVPTMISEKIRRSQGIVLLTLYVAYVVVMCTVFTA